jgi:predicted oxidoreductase
MDADVIVVGGGLAGLGRGGGSRGCRQDQSFILDQEPEQSLGGQAFWSFGGLDARELARAAPSRH